MSTRAEWIATLVAVLCIAGIATCAVMLAKQTSDDIGSGRPWIRECAQHRPLAECKRDWAEMRTP